MGLAAALICSLHAFLQTEGLTFLWEQRSGQYFDLKVTASSDCNSNTEQSYVVL